MRNSCKKKNEVLIIGLEVKSVIRHQLIMPFGHWNIMSKINTQKNLRTNDYK